jgi:hypothetical protein
LNDLHITVGFSTTNKWISRLIRWVTRGRVSHAWIAFFDPCLDMRLVMQAEAWGYEVRPWKRWKRQNVLVAEFKTDRQLSNSLQWIAKSLGVEYDWKAAFFAGLRRWLGRWLRGRFRSPRKLMCSEAVIRFLQHAGVSAVAQLDPELTPPQRLLEAVEKSPDFSPVHWEK